MSALVIGDLHGKINIAKEILQEKQKNIIFIGDYLDSYELNVAEQIDLLDMILDAIEAEPDRIYGLIGNHELSYIDPTKWVCSGWRADTQTAINSRKGRMLKNLAVCAKAEDFFITHAGVSKTWLPKDVEDPIKYVLEADMDELTVVGWSRGGLRDTCGGPFWCDWYDEFVPIPNFKQIVGHTGSRRIGDGILYTDDMDNYNIDCLDFKKEILEIRTDKSVSIVTL